MKSIILKKFLQVLLSFFLVILLDILWFSFMGNTYDIAFEPLRPEFNTELTPNLLVASILVYFLSALAIVFFVLPRVKEMNYSLSFLWGGFLGLIIFGIYNLTNYLILSKWPLHIAILDISWGFLVYGFTTIVVKSLTSFIQNRYPK